MKQFILSGVLALSLVGCASQEEVDKAVNAEIDKTYNKVADDAVAQYEIAKKQGDKVQICVQAGLVSASYLQAKNEAKYNEWKAIEKADCAKAGMPK